MIHEGDIIGGTYQVVKQIGRGGSGLVFLAYHRNLRKYVVIKRVQTNLANLETLRAETDILKNLRHRSIPQVFDFLVSDGEVFTVMEYMEGTSFDQLPAGGKQLSETQLLRMLLQLADVLSYIHRHRPAVIHSDIKPDNLILGPDGYICLIDFNISVSTGVSNSLSGYSMHFASPEQMNMIREMSYGRNPQTRLDARTDIYSTGALFYYLATGLYPDTRCSPSNPGGTAGNAPQKRVLAGGAVYGGLPDASVFYQDLRAFGFSDAFCRVIARCLESDRNQRYADGSKLYAAVRHLHRQDKRFRRYILLRAGSWILTAMLIGSGIWLLMEGAHQKVLDIYTRDLQAFTAAQERGDTAAAAESSAALLSEKQFQKILEGRPQDRVILLQCLGDEAYAKKQYAESWKYYEEALQTAKAASLETSRCYRDYAIASIMDGKYIQAQDALNEARASANGISDPDNALVQAYLMIQRKDEGNDPEGCIALCESILQMNADADQKARACVLAADACLEREDTDSGKTDEERIKWLSLAVQYSGETRYQRMLASAYMEQADDSRRSESQRKSSAQKALECYERITELPYSLPDDWISRVVVMQYIGEFEESKQILRQKMQEYPDDYRFPMYMAFACDQTGDPDNAAQYAKKAKDLYDAMPAGSREAESSEAIARLEQIAKR